jgi:hypothetical protein
MYFSKNSIKMDATLQQQQQNDKFRSKLVQIRCKYSLPQFKSETVNNLKLLETSKEKTNYFLDSLLKHGTAQSSLLRTMNNLFEFDDLSAKFTFKSRFKFKK